MLSVDALWNCFKPWLAGTWLGLRHLADRRLTVSIHLIIFCPACLVS